MADEPTPRPPSAPTAVPMNPELVRRKRPPAPGDEDDALFRGYWPQIAPLGRHGYALSRTSGFVGGALFFGFWTGAISLERLFRGPTGDDLAWLLVLGVPVVVAVYVLLLARYDQDAARYGGGHVTLAAWREREAQAAAARDPSRMDA